MLGKLASLAHVVQALRDNKVRFSPSPSTPALSQMRACA